MGRNSGNSDLVSKIWLVHLTLSVLRSGSFYACFCVCIALTICYSIDLIDLLMLNSREHKTTLCNLHMY